MNRHKHQCRGFAYIMVMISLGVATILGFAILSNATIQAAAGGGAVKSVKAEYLAESALQAAMLGLQYPAKVPSTWATISGHTMLASQVAFSGVGGSFDLDVVPTSTRNSYTLTGTGRDDGVPPLTHTATALIQVKRATPTYAAVFGGAATLGARTTITGSTLCSGSISFTSSGTINGSIKNGVGSTDFVIPTSLTINCYGAGASAGTYSMPDGASATPTALAGQNLVAFPAVAPSTNAGSVFFYNGDLSIVSATTLALAGTLVVKGNLTVSGVGVTVNPVSGMPALITTGALKVSGKNCVIKLNGVAYTGAGISWLTAPNTGSSVQIDGSLLVPAGGTLTGSTTGAISATYNASRVNVPDISIAAQPVTSLKLQSWKQ